MRGEYNKGMGKGAENTRDRNILGKCVRNLGRDGVSVEITVRTVGRFDYCYNYQVVVAVVVEVVLLLSL